MVILENKDGNILHW